MTSATSLPLLGRVDLDAELRAFIAAAENEANLLGDRFLDLCRRLVSLNGDGFGAFDGAPPPPHPSPRDEQPCGQAIDAFVGALPDKVTKVLNAILLTEFQGRILAEIKQSAIRFHQPPATLLGHFLDVRHSLSFWKKLHTLANKLAWPAARSHLYHTRYERVSSSIRGVSSTRTWTPRDVDMVQAAVTSTAGAAPCVAAAAAAATTATAAAAIDPPGMSVPPETEASAIGAGLGPKMANVSLRRMPKERQLWQLQEAEAPLSGAANALCESSRNADTPFDALPDTDIRDAQPPDATDEQPQGQELEQQRQVSPQLQECREDTPHKPGGEALLGPGARVATPLPGPPHTGQLPVGPGTSPLSPAVNLDHEGDSLSIEQGRRYSEIEEWVGMDSGIANDDDDGGDTESEQELQPEKDAETEAVQCLLGDASATTVDASTLPEIAPFAQEHGRQDETGSEEQGQVADADPSALAAPRSPDPAPPQVSGVEQRKRKACESEEPSPTTISGTETMDVTEPPKCPHRDPCPSSPPQKKSRSVHAISLRRLADREGWLDDTIIHAALERLVSARPSFFLTIDPLVIAAESPPAGVVRRLASQPCATLLLPLHVGSSHWILAAVVRSRHCVDLYDSLPSSNAATSKSTHALLARFFQSHLPEDSFSKWSVAAAACAQQTDSYSCGIAVLAHASHLIAGAAIPRSLNFDLWRLTIAHMLQPTPRPGEGSRNACPRDDEAPSQIGVGACAMPSIAEWLGPLGVDISTIPHPPPPPLTPQSLDLSSLAALEEAHRAYAEQLAQLREAALEARRAEYQRLTLDMDAHFRIWDTMGDHATTTAGNMKALTADLSRQLDNRRQGLAMLMQYPNDDIENVLRAEMAAVEARIAEVNTQAAAAEDTRRAIRDVCRALDTLTEEVLSLSTD